MPTILDIGMAILGKKIKMTMTFTKINYSDIDQTIFEECFTKSLPYLEADKPNIVWEEFGLTKSSSTADKLNGMKTAYADHQANDVIFKVDIDGRIVCYSCGMREHQGDRMFSHELDLMREDASGSQGWSYTAEYNTKWNEFYKSQSDDCLTSSVWVVEGSSMEKAYNDSVFAGWITFTNSVTLENHHGYRYKKLVVTFKV